MFKPDSLWQWVLLGSIVIELIIVLGLESWALYAFETALDPSKLSSPTGGSAGITDDFGNTITSLVPYSRSLPTFLALYIFGMIYMLGLAWDAIRLKNTIQIIGICCFNWMLCLYGILQETQIRDTLNRLTEGNALRTVTADGQNVGNLEQKMDSITVAVPAVLGLGSLIISFAGWKLYREFAWTIYKHVSADLQLRKRYMNFEIYIAILKFDFFFFLAFTMEFLVLLSANLQDYEFYITVAAVPITVIILIAAGFIVRRESRPLQWCVLLFYLIGLAYFVFKVVRIWAGDPSSEHRETYAPAARPLTVVASFAIVMLLLTLYTGWQCLQNFGRGLKPFVNKRAVQEDEDKLYMNDLPNVNHPTMDLHSTQPNRMVIE